MSKDNERHVTGIISVSGEIETRLPPDVVSQREAERKEDKAADKKKTAREVKTLVVVSLYTAIAAVQGWLMFKANSLTASALTSVQRAFIYPLPSASQQTGKDGKPIGFMLGVGWSNSGTTPTKDLTSHFSNQIFQKDIPENFNFPDLWSDGAAKVNRRFVLSPKGEVAGQETFFLSNADTALDSRAILPAGSNLYLWGWAKYRDVFESTPRHITEYCYRVVTIPQLPNKNALPGISGVEFDQCARHNCQDEECEDYKQQISK